MKLERKYRGSLSLPVFLVCVIVIMNVHGNVQSSFRQKAMVYKALDLTDAVETPTPDVNSMWSFLKTKYLRFFHAIDGAFSPKRTRVFSKMRQIRVIPPTEPCVAPRMPVFEVDVKHCHHVAIEGNIDRRDHARNWEPYDEKLGSKLSQDDAIYHYTPAKVESLLEYVGAEYPLGGYQYILSASYGDNTEMFRKMEFSNWVDENTRAIILETSVFDFNTGIATSLVITYHYLPDGIRFAYENNSFAFSFHGSSIFVLLLAFISLASLVLVELSTQYSKATSLGVMNYMRDIENMMTVTSLTFYIFILVGFVFRYQITNDKYETLSRTIYGTDGALFLNLRDLGFMVFCLNNLSGFLAFAALMTIFQSAKNIPKLYIMLMMIRNVFILSTFPALIVYMMAILSYLAFQTESYENSTFKNACYGVIQFVLSPRGLSHGTVGVSSFFTVFQWAAFFVIITNGFLVSLNDDYSVLVVETKKKGSKSILSSLTEMALASAGVINLEDVGTSRSEREEERREHAIEHKRLDQMFYNMSNGW